MWFKRLVGFKEISPENVRDNLVIDGKNIISKVNGKSFQFGSLEVPTLEELKGQSPPLEGFKDKIRVSEVVADVQDLHRDKANEHALFQAASQFNLLEMVGPHITPEDGIGRYEGDYTQGPFCAIACGAGTIYRNYFAPVNGQTGQSADNQIDCLALIGEELNHAELQLWKMTNGYALATQEGLVHINAHLSKLNDDQREALKGKLKIGIQWDTQVTLLETKQIVSQAYCSALPVAYADIDPAYWENFARIILEATYEATLYAALINREKTGSNKVYVTFVGGGAFGNTFEWIMDSILSSIRKFAHTPLEVGIVSYGGSNKRVTDAINSL